MQMKTIIVFLITLCTTDFGRVGLGLENLYNVGLGWVGSITQWVESDRVQ